MISSAHAYLMLAGPPRLTWAYPIADHRVSIGRDAGGDLRLVHPTVSKLHCEIWAGNQKIYLRDMKSATGTFVNGVRVMRRQLQFGDLVQIGPAIMQMVRPLGASETILEVDFKSDQGAVAEEPDKTSALAGLPPRERGIGRMLAEGESEKEVAAARGENGRS